MELPSNIHSNVVEDYINSLSYSSVVTVSNASQQLRMDTAQTETVLNALVAQGILACTLSIRCPECSLLIEIIKDIPVAEITVYCYGCEDNVAVDASDTEMIYTLLPNFRPQ